MSRRTPILAFIVFALSLFAVTAHAQVSDEDWGFTLSGGPLIRTGPSPPGVGPALGFRANKGVHPLWNLGVEAMLALPVTTNGHGPYLSGGLFAGFSTSLDVVSVVPWAGLSLGVLFEPGSPDHSAVANPAAMLSVGLDVRKKRDSSWGFQADVIGALQPKFDAARYVRVGFRYTWMRSKSGI